MLVILVLFYKIGENLDNVNLNIDTHTKHLTYTQVYVPKSEGTYKNFLVNLGEAF